MRVSRFRTWLLNSFFNRNGLKFILIVETIGGVPQGFICSQTITYHVNLDCSCKNRSRCYYVCTILVLIEKAFSYAVV